MDINKRMDLSLLKKSLNMIASSGQELCDIYGHFSRTAIFNERIEVLRKLKDEPIEFLQKANIQYWAPKDASCTGLADCSVDCHFSVSVFEHIPKDTLKRILTEGSRILKNQGIAIHFIDTSDHFSHQDKSINGINFLRFSREEWGKIANNEYAYCNRLRASDYRDIFVKSELAIIRQEMKREGSIKTKLEAGFPLHGDYSKYSEEDILCAELKIMLRKNGC